MPFRSLLALAIGATLLMPVSPAEAHGRADGGPIIAGALGFGLGAVVGRNCCYGGYYGVPSYYAPPPVYVAPPPPVYYSPPPVFAAPPPPYYVPSPYYAPAPTFYYGPRY